MEQNWQEQNQKVADDQPSCDGNNKGGHWLQNSLKIVGRKNVKGQKQERKRVYPNDSRRNCKNRRSGAHKNTDIKVRTSQTDSVTDRICSVTCPNPSYKNFTLAVRAVGKRAPGFSAGILLLLKALEYPLEIRGYCR